MLYTTHKNGDDRGMVYDCYIATLHTKKNWFSDVFRLFPLDFFGDFRHPISAARVFTVKSHGYLTVELLEGRNRNPNWEWLRFVLTYIDMPILGYVRLWDSLGIAVEKLHIGWYEVAGVLWSKSWRRTVNWFEPTKCKAFLPRLVVPPSHEFLMIKNCQWEEVIHALPFGKLT